MHVLYAAIPKPLHNDPAWRDWRRRHRFHSTLAAMERFTAAMIPAFRSMQQAFVQMSVPMRRISQLMQEGGVGDVDR
jgi:hypothetical protein